MFCGLNHLVQNPNIRDIAEKVLFETLHGIASLDY